MKYYKLVAPEFFDYTVTVEEYYSDAITEAMKNNTSVFCHFEGDRHASIYFLNLLGEDLNSFSLSDEELRSIEITMDTVFE